MGCPVRRHGPPRRLSVCPHPQDLCPPPIFDEEQNEASWYLFVISGWTERNSVGRGLRPAVAHWISHISILYACTPWSSSNSDICHSQRLQSDSEGQIIIVVHKFIYMLKHTFSDQGQLSFGGMQRLYVWENIGDLNKIVTSPCQSPCFAKRYSGRTISLHGHEVSLGIWSNVQTKTKKPV